MPDLSFSVGLAVFLAGAGDFFSAAIYGVAAARLFRRRESPALRRLFYSIAGFSLYNLIEGALFVYYRFQFESALTAGLFISVAASIILRHIPNVLLALYVIGITNGHDYGHGDHSRKESHDDEG